MNPALRLALVALVSLAALALAFAVLSSARIYRFESRFYRPPRHTPQRPQEPRALRDVSFRAPDGSRQAGWYHAPRAPRGPAVVLTHASLGDRAQLAPQAAWLVAHGYGVLLFDWPGHGESGGRVTYGRAEVGALRAALDWLAAQTEVDPRRIGGLGCSLGAYLLLVGAGEDQRLRAVVAEGAPTDLVAVTHWQYRRRAPFGAWAALLAARHAGADVGTTSALLAAARVPPRALLLIAGERDQVVPPSMSDALHAAAPGSELWRVPGAGHCDIRDVAPDEYRRRVLSFFERALAGEGEP